MLAFLCGDHNKSWQILNSIEIKDLDGCYESSTYYALKSLSGFTCDQTDVLKYAKLSLDILPEDDSSFYAANAKLTYAQVLSSVNKYREAADLFYSAYTLFCAKEIYFTAAVSLVNYLLNRYKLGDFKYVIEECNKVLASHSDFKGNCEEYWNVAKLPLGMCCFELNMQNLAIKYLSEARACIDNLNLLHMHGLVEVYLIKSYYLLGDKSSVDDLIRQANSDFGHMLYSSNDLLLCAFRVLSDLLQPSQELQSDIERLELEYINNRTKAYSIIPEMLSYLKFKNMSDAVTIDDITELLEKFRFWGNVPNIQLFLVLLAEIYFNQNEHKQASECLKEAAAIYQEYGIYASFLMYPFNSCALLKSINKSLYKKIDIRSKESDISVRSSILSKKEKEIIQLMAAGNNNEEISKSLFISVGTVKWHINNIFSKLEADNRVKAIERARALGEL